MHATHLSCKLVRIELRLDLGIEHLFGRTKELHIHVVMSTSHHLQTSNNACCFKPNVKLNGLV